MVDEPKDAFRCGLSPQFSRGRVAQVAALKLSFPVPDSSDHLDRWLRMVTARALHAERREGEEAGENYFPKSIMYVWIITFQSQLWAMWLNWGCRPIRGLLAGALVCVRFLLVFCCGAVSRAAPRRGACSFAALQMHKATNRSHAGALVEGASRRHLQVCSSAFDRSH